MAKGRSPRSLRQERRSDVSASRFGVREEHDSESVDERHQAESLLAPHGYLLPIVRSPASRYGMKANHYRGGTDHKITMGHSVTNLSQGGLVLFVARHAVVECPEPFDLGRVKYVLRLRVEPFRNQLERPIERALFAEPVQLDLTVSDRTVARRELPNPGYAKQLRPNGGLEIVRDD